MPSSPITSHILDTASGQPAAGVAVLLEFHAKDAWKEVGRERTNDDGRAVELLAGPLTPGTYRLTFETGDYFRSQGGESFHPSVSVTFGVATADEHYHVPLLISPFGYTTYRGS